jgi:16S rRNA (guanine1207-N2)-methyltransferase
VTRPKQRGHTSAVHVADVIRPKIKSPLAIVLGSPGEVAHWAGLLASGEIACFQMDLFLAERLEAELAERQIKGTVKAAADLWDLPGDYQTLLYLPPRGGERSLKIDMAEQGFHLLREGGTLVVLSPYDRDDLFPGLLKKIYGEVRQTIVGGSTVFWSVRRGERPRRRHQTSFHVRLSEAESLSFLSRPGVFAYGRLDEGARALVDTMHINPGDRILDLGCGCGTNGIIAARRAGPNGKVTLVDSNLRAIALTLENVRTNGIVNFSTHAAHMLPTLEDAPFDVILANPPYYAQAVLPQLFIDAAERCLKPDGRFYLVTKQTEPAATILTETFPFVEVANCRGYQVFCSGRTFPK